MLSEFQHPKTQRCVRPKISWIGAGQEVLSQEPTFPAGSVGSRASGSAVTVCICQAIQVLPDYVPFDGAHADERGG